MIEMDIRKEQEAVCGRWHTQWTDPMLELKVGIAENARTNLMPLNGLRHRPQGDTSGWYIWAGDLSDDPEFFRPLHGEHLVEWCPAILPYLGLPPGYRFLIAPGHEDVWKDDSLLGPE